PCGDPGARLGRTGIARRGGSGPDRRTGTPVRARARLRRRISPHNPGRRAARRAAGMTDRVKPDPIESASMKAASIKTIPLTVVDSASVDAVPIEKQLGEDKIARNRAAFADAPALRKPSWIRVRIPPGNAVAKLKAKLRENRLVTVCEEASCPNIHECFGKGTATFMILGEVCTRRCSFCDVAHGRPKPPDPLEPAHLAGTIRDMGLKYVVITSVDRDDLRDGGAAHFAACIKAVRFENPTIRIEILTPDFRGKGRMERALEALAGDPPDVFNHNLETVRELYREVRPGADYD